MSARSTSPVSSSHQGSPPPGELSLRHLTSNSGLASNRNSQMLQPTGRYGSKSPSEIPSSPTSIHSSSSAIFERDIEPLNTAPTSPHSATHVTNPHFMARAKASEQLEQSVPSVLDSAAEVLATMQPTDPDAEHVAVISPAAPETRSTSGFTSPIDSFRSRSPSPSPMTASYNRGNLLSTPAQTNSLPTSQQSVATPTTAAAPRPAVNTSTSPTQSPRIAPSIVTPTSAYFSTASSADEDSPLTTTVEQPPSFPPSSFSPTGPSSHPPSPTHVARKRLSFMSYKDLVTSTPASTQLLSSLTTSASSVEPPPHIGIGQGSPLLGSGGSDVAPSLLAFSLREPDSADEVGGEWQREGLGRGLEERLEALMPIVGNKS